MATPNESGTALDAPPGRQRFIQRLDLILHKLDAVARRRNMKPEEREDFISWALLRMVESDYTVVREWRGEARFRSYLNVVVSRLLLDFRNHRWGRFRVSKAARRAGRAAELLDVLIHRDGFTTEEAVEVVMRNHRVGSNRTRLRQLAESLPERQSRRTYPIDDAPLPAIPPAAADGLRRAERQTLCRKVQRSLDDALGDMQCEDLRILVLRFCCGCTADQIGADLNLDRRRVYQRIETILARLRRRLSGEGFEAAEVLDLVGADGVDMQFDRFDRLGGAERADQLDAAA